MIKFKQSLVALFVCLVTILAPSSARGQAGEKPTSNVSVVNTPNVNVVNTPNVNVANTVQVSEPRREAVNVSGQFEGNNGQTSGVLYTVTPGKQLVVTYVSALAFVEDGQQALTVVRAVDENGGGDFFFHYLKLVAVQTTFGSASSLASDPLQFRLDAGTRVEASMWATRADVIGSGFASLRVSISGYLVDVPQQ